jgi:6-phosphogluconolactonase
MSSRPTRQVPGQLVTAKDAAAVAHEGASRLEAALKAALASRGRATLALSGGNTPREAYSTLARAAGIDWSKVDVFWVDERAVPPGDDRSNYRWAKATLLDGARIDPANVHRMPADAPDLAAAAKAYEKVVKDRVAADAEGVPAFDAMVMGVGDDGHTASLFPGDPAVDVTDRFVVAVASQHGLEARLTLTRTVITRARLVLVLVEGAAKRDALAKAWAPEGDVHVTPSRILRESKGQVVWIVDEVAAA